MRCHLQANTGGAANVITYAWKLMHEPASGYTPEGFELCITDELGTNAATGTTGEAIKRDVMQLVKEGALNETLSIFNPNEAEQEGKDFVSVMLDALTRDDDKWIDSSSDTNSG